MIPQGVAVWLGTLAGKLCVGLGILTTIGGLWAAFALHYENKGAAKLIQTSQTEGKRINAKNSTVTANAKRPGAFGRLLKNDCRDC